MSYIEREKALDAVLFALVGTGYQSKAIYAIKDVPTAGVEEVRHGEWKKTITGIICSVCDTHEARITSYCPNCGAKMDGERREGLDKQNS